MVVRDKKKVLSKMNGKEYNASAFAHSLSVNLYQEHLSLSKGEVLDPLSPVLLMKIDTIAKVCMYKRIVEIMILDSKILKSIGRCLDASRMMR